MSFKFERTVQAGFFLYLTACALVFPSEAAKPKPKAKQSAKTDEVASPIPVPVPLTLDKMPASSPQVIFADGQLTILALNSTMADILREVRNQTGASVDVPGDATNRVVGSFGPGPARDVLAALLNGSHFNYVLLGSSTDPKSLDRVMLFSASSEPVPEPTVGGALEPAPPMVTEDDGAELPDDPADQPPASNSAALAQQPANLKMP
jgi:hypothetical protein